VQKRERPSENSKSILLQKRERTFDSSKWFLVRDPRGRERQRKAEHDPVEGVFKSPEDKNIDSKSSSLEWVEFPRRRLSKRAGRPFRA
jgi:hypothetical protein